MHTLSLQIEKKGSHLPVCVICACRIVYDSARAILTTLRGNKDGAALGDPHHTKKKWKKQKKSISCFPPRRLYKLLLSHEVYLCTQCKTWTVFPSPNVNNCVSTHLHVIATYMRAVYVNVCVCVHILHRYLGVKNKKDWRQIANGFQPVCIINVGKVYTVVGVADLRNDC